MPWLDKNSSIDEIRKAFAADKFATEQSSVRIVEAGYHHAICSMPITEQHLNAQGLPMGGAIFTLADFCLAVISNVGEEPTSSVSASIDFLTVAKGRELRAVGHVAKSGRNLGFYSIDIFDEQDNKVAVMNATCYRRAK